MVLSALPLSCGTPSAKWILTCLPAAWRPVRQMWQINLNRRRFVFRNAYGLGSIAKLLDKPLCKTAWIWHRANDAPMRMAVYLSAALCGAVFAMALAASAQAQTIKTEPVALAAVAAEL